MQSRSITFYTLGCRSNQSETAVIINLLEQNNYVVLSPGKKSDIAIINTCTVTKKADADTRRLINRILRINPKTQIALIGCQAQVQKDQLFQLPNVQWIIGNQKKFDLVAILKGTSSAHAKQIITPPIQSKPFTVPTPGIDRYHTRANIKIQDGCDSYCSYCEVPYARGSARSRKFPDIIKEAKVLVKSGHKELILTGINVGNYSFQQKNIVDVINALEQIPDLLRIRISSIEPSSILPKLIKKMAQKDNKLCRYLHVPIQSASDEVLKSMGRKYNSRYVLHLVREAFQCVEGICIGTDIIVGFPGETEAYFEDTRKKFSDAPIHYFHVFRYSPRNMAASKNFPNKIDRQTSERRSQILRQLSKDKRKSFYNAMLGKEYSVLFEQKKGGFWKGLTDNFLHIKTSSSGFLANQVCRVKLTKVINEEIIGKIIE